MKPGIDWVEIRERYRAGETPYQIAKDVDVTRQAIMKRAAKEKWDKPKTVTLTGGDWLPDVTGFPELIDRPKFNPERIEDALKAVAVGANHQVAAAMAGVSVETWRLWREASPKFQEAIEAAQAHNAHKALLSINRASEGGDWKAAQAQLASNPLTKDDFAQKEGRGGGIFNVIVNIPRATAEEIERTHQVIDVTPE